MDSFGLQNEIICSESGDRLDRFVSQACLITRTRAANLIDDGYVLVNDKVRAKNFRLSQGDAVFITVPPSEEIITEAENIPLDIVFEDKDLIVVNKPQGMVVHPAPGNYTGTLVNALLYHCKDSLSGINGKLRPGIVHRIDKDTSGLLVVAKNDTSHQTLAEMFKDHSFSRQYQAILYGAPKADEGTVNLSIGRSKKDRKKMAFYPLGEPNAKEAVTHFKILERFQNYSHAQLTLETGRTHQIRVHMLSMSCPVLADPLYAAGRKTFGLEGQCLHAKNIGFIHPTTKKELFFDSPLPDYFQNTLDLIRKSGF